MRASFEHIEQYRIDHPQLGRGRDRCGFFVIREGNVELRCQASDGMDWEHVSVVVLDHGYTTPQTRCATWPEMAAVKAIFWHEDECVMQLHVPSVDHVNIHPHCLHLWRPRRGQQIPRPPSILVGPRALGL